MSSQPEIHAINERVLMECPLSPLKLSAPPIECEDAKNSRLVFQTDPCGLAVEQYKLLARRLCSSRPEGGLLLVTSPSPGDGKSLTSINLAWCLAEGGHSTCLVDLDFRAPGLCLGLGCKPPSEGIVEVLSGATSITKALRQIGGVPLYLLGMKEALPSPARYLRSETLRPLATKLRDTFEWVILDIAPAIPISDVAEVLPHADGAIMVVRAGKTKKSLVQPTLQILESKLWGVVLNDSMVLGSAYYGYYGYGNSRKAKKR